VNISGILRAIAVACTLLAGVNGKAVLAAEPDSPQIDSDGRVTFRLQAPEATNVTLHGDWPGGAEDTQAAMTKDPQGIWSLTVGPLKPDLWTYWFTVNGVKVADDRNVHFSYDRWGDFYQSLLFVPGPASYNYELHEVPHGTVSAIWYSAPSLHINARRALVYTPPGYATSRQKYPVLYLSSNEETGWTLLGRAPTILDNLIAAGKAKPMIVVMPNTQPDAAASSDAIDELLPSTKGRPSRFLPESNVHGGRLSSLHMLVGGQSIALDLVPFVDKTFRTLADREHRAIAGLSASGAASFYAGVNHLELFGWIGIFSGGFPALPGVWIEIPMPANASQFYPHGPDIKQSVDPEKLAALMPDLTSKANLRLLYFSVGTSDSLLTTHSVVKRILDERGVKYVSVEVPGYRHEWRFWRWCLSDFAPRLF
jgi:enterochelin esterase-like enzyme